MERTSACRRPGLLNRATPTVEPQARDKTGWMSRARRTLLTLSASAFCWCVKNSVDAQYLALLRRALLHSEHWHLSVSVPMRIVQTVKLVHRDVATTEERTM